MTTSFFHQAQGWFVFLILVGFLAANPSCRPSHSTTQKTEVRTTAKKEPPPSAAPCYKQGVFVRAPSRQNTRDPWPLLIGIHGGGWANHFPEDPKRDSRNPIGYAKDLERLWQHESIAVAVVTYQLSTPYQKSWPENLEDIRSAIRCLRNYADQYGVDPNRFFLMGESAGAHLALLATLYPEGEVYADKIPAQPREPIDGISSKVNGVISFFAPTDLPTFYSSGDQPTKDFARLRLRAMIGGTLNELRPNYEAASPVLHITKDSPPILLLHGMQDELISYTQARNLADRLAEANVSYELILARYGGHEFHGPYLNLGDCSMIGKIKSFIYGRKLEEREIILEQC